LADRFLQKLLVPSHISPRINPPSADEERKIEEDKMEATTSRKGSSSSQRSESIESLAARVQRLEDIEAINHLLVRYAQGSDKHNDPDIMVPLFTEDAVFDVGSGYGTYVGQEAIRKFLEGALNIIKWSLHYMISPLIEVAEDGRTAKVFCYLWEIANMPNRDSELEPVLIGGTYDNDAVKLASGEWKFSVVRLRMEIMSPYYKGWVKKPFHDFGIPQTDNCSIVQTLECWPI
jgi:hypothetical protein